MARTLHIHNILQKQYLEHGTLLRLLTFTIVFYKWFYISTPTVTPTNYHLHMELASAENCISPPPPPPPPPPFAIRRTNLRTHELIAPFLMPIYSVVYKAGLWTLTFCQISRTSYNKDITILYNFIVEPHPLHVLSIIVVHALTVPYAELPSNEQKREWKQLQSRETIFYIAFVVRYHC